MDALRRSGPCSIDPLSNGSIEPIQAVQQHPGGPRIEPPAAGSFVLESHQQIPRVVVGSPQAHQGQVRGQRRPSRAREIARGRINRVAPEGFAQAPGLQRHAC